MNSHIKKP